MVDTRGLAAPAAGSAAGASRQVSNGEGRAGERGASPQVPTSAGEVQDVPDAAVVPSEPVAARGGRGGAYWKTWAEEVRAEAEAAGVWAGHRVAECETLLADHTELLQYAAQLERRLRELQGKCEPALQPPVDVSLSVPAATADLTTPMQVAAGAASPDDSFCARLGASGSFSCASVVSMGGPERPTSQVASSRPSRVPVPAAGVSLEEPRLGASGSFGSSLGVTPSEDSGSLLPRASTQGLIPRLDLHQAHAEGQPATGGTGDASEGVLHAGGNVQKAAMDGSHGKVQKVAMVLEISEARARELLEAHGMDVRAALNSVVSTTPRIAPGRQQTAHVDPHELQEADVEKLCTTLVVTEQRARELLRQHGSLRVAINQAVSNTPRRGPASAPGGGEGGRTTPRLCFILRHSERADDISAGAVANAAALAYPGFDPPITDAGRALARRGAEAIMASIPPAARREIVVVASPYRRCLATAEEICSVVPGCIAVHPGLAEMHVAKGQWEGGTAPVLPAHDHHAVGSGALPPYPETVGHARDRFVGTISHLMDSRFPTQTVVVVTHGPALDFMSLALSGRRVKHAGYCAWLQLGRSAAGTPWVVDRSHGVEYAEGHLDL
eukprot:TRINITY_DN22724_c0_g1_i1.p1 TRINITY_DN22724_c0_g1~~TRINITY_DN22724_c0_g1_i1.p1  ORF type:complete len:614 (+),score=79.65 TRINITY_DN22724_c0_g1_i1:39-1880(+)